MLRGNAFMIMWHDIAAAGEDEYHHWHSEQHMPERLGHRGFRRSRRGVNWSYRHQRYFTLYEGDRLETFVSDDYLASLNGPTEWTSQVAPHFRNFLRCACEVVHSAGRGVGGAFTTIRGRIPAGMTDVQFASSLRPHLDDLLDQPKVCGVHLGLARPEFSDYATRETELRPQMRESPFDFVLIVEGFDLHAFEHLEGEIEGPLHFLRCRELTSRAYAMAYMLEEEE